MRLYCTHNVCNNKSNRESSHFSLKEHTAKLSSKTQKNSLYLSQKKKYQRNSIFVVKHNS